MNTMASYRTTIDSTLPPEVAFAELADFSSTELWDPGVVEARRLDDGALAVGSRFRVVASIAGRHVPLEYEIVDIDRPNRVVLRAENASVVSLDTITFAPSPTGTAVRYDADLRLKGPLRILDPVLALVFRRIGDRARDGLRRMLCPQAHQPAGTV
jgi:hypothetical protein